MESLTGSYNYDHQSAKGTITSVAFLLFVIFMIITFSISAASEDKKTSLFDSLETVQPVYFDYGSAELKPNSYEVLNKLADMLIHDPGMKLHITGHTDDKGGEEFNLVLSEKRALAVKGYLVSKGCSPENILVEGKGKSEPLNTNSNNLERSLNRRVEFKLINPKQTISDAKPKMQENDIAYLNTSLVQESRDEIKCELSVRDSSGSPLEGLKEEDVSSVLKWINNGIKDSAAGNVKFIPIDDKKKIAFTLTMDYSPSMYSDKFDFEMDAPKSPKIIAMENAVKTFIELMDENNTAKVIKFGRVVDLVQTFTDSKYALKEAITTNSYPREGTALYKSIYAALYDDSFEDNPTVMKTVIAFTDGEENASGYITKDSIYKLSEVKGIKVFTVGLINAAKHSYPLGLRSKDEKDLVEIAGRTGGFYWWAENEDDLQEIYTSIHNQIMKSYQVSIIWNADKLPPKGTNVTAVIRVNLNGRIRTVYKNYIME